MKTNFGFLSLLLGLGLLACGAEDDATTDDDTVDAGDDDAADDDTADDDTGDDDAADDDTADDDTADDDTADDDTADDDTADDDAPDAGDDDAPDAGDDDAPDAGDDDAPDAGDDDTLDSGSLGFDAGPTTPTGDAAPATGDAAADAGAPSGCAVPTELGVFTPESGAAEGFDIDGNRAYVAATSAGVYVVDLSDPSQPASIGQYDFPPGQLAYRVAANGNVVAVGMRGNGWSLLDVSDLEDIQLSSSDDSVSAEDVAIRGNILYYVDGTGVDSVDISEPTAPVPLTMDLVLPGNSDTLLVVGDLIYVASSGAGISVVDASDPAALVELSSVDVGTGSSHIALADGRLYAAHSEGVTILDVADPSMPVPVGEYVRERSHEVALLDQHLFVFGDDTNQVDVPFVTIVDVSDPTTPIEAVSGEPLTAPVVARIDAGVLFVSVEDDDSLHLFEACPTP